MAQQRAKRSKRLETGDGQWNVLGYGGDQASARAEQATRQVDLSRVCQTASLMWVVAPVASSKSHNAS